LSDEILVLHRVQPVRDHLAIAIDNTDVAIVMLPSAIRAHQSHEEGRELEDLGLLCVLVQQSLQASQGHERGGPRLGDTIADVLASFFGKGRPNSPRDSPGGMDLTAAQLFDDLLAELPQTNAAACQLRLGLYQSKDVSRCWVTLHAQEQVRSTQVKKA